MPRKSPHICILADGRRVPFSVNPRPDDPYYFVYFRGPDGRRLEKSTKEGSQKRALDAAYEVIKGVYQPKPLVYRVTWDDAIADLKRHLEANGNRPDTIHDYLDTPAALRSIFPASSGPADITPALAKQFKVDYMTRGFTRQKVKVEPPPVGNPSEASPKRRGRKPKPKLPVEPKVHRRASRPVASRLKKLRVIWSKWFIQELEYFTVNPWEDAAPPKLDKLTPRYLTAEEIQAFFLWLRERWNGWRLPVLFFTVKGFLGNRISELSSLRSEQLQEGRVVFPADETKGRDERKALLPADVYAELKELAGPTFVWEAYPTQVLQKLKELGRPFTKLQTDFSPDRLKWWLQDELDDYCKQHPEVKRFLLVPHDCPL